MRPLSVPLLMAAGCLLLLVAILQAGRLWMSGLYRVPENAAVVSTVTAEAVESARHPLTGEVLQQEISPPTVFALMIDNSIDAWPQSGLNDAFLVIETLAEGRIPRFIVFFGADQTVEKIGPVRSARSYFIEWASAFGAVFGHVGGSPDALLQLSTANVIDLNQYYWGDFFWRSFDRYAPHNVYTSTELLNEAIALDEESSAPLYTYWIFKEDVVLEQRPEQGKIVVADFGSEEYLVEWEYDPETNTYTRFQGGTLTLLQDESPMVANNVIVLFTEMEILDAIGRRDIRTIGEGEALVYQDGIVIEAVWKKETEESMLKFFTVDGEEVKMNAGKTWIEVVE